MKLLNNRMTGKAEIRYSFSRVLVEKNGALVSPAGVKGDPRLLERYFWGHIIIRLLRSKETNYHLERS